jgi:hypothetical protein
MYSRSWVNGCFVGGDAIDGDNYDHKDEREHGECFGRTRDDAVVEGKNCKFVKACDEIPASSDVASNEYADSQGGEGVHAQGRTIMTLEFRDQCAALCYTSTARHSVQGTGTGPGRHCTIMKCT